MPRTCFLASGRGKRTFCISIVALSASEARLCLSMSQQCNERNLVHLACLEVSVMLLKVHALRVSVHLC